MYCCSLLLTYFNIAFICEDTFTLTCQPTREKSNVNILACMFHSRLSRSVSNVNNTNMKSSFTIETTF